MEQSRNKILLSIGSNTGDRVKNINRAYDLLKSASGIYNVSFSSYYNTSPVGYSDQGDFINAAIYAETTLTPEELLYLIKSIEYSVGRIKREKWHKREIDLDIILFGKKILNYKHLTIPHKEMYKRKFVLSPANEIAPDLIHPVFNKNINQLFRAYKGDEQVTKL